MKKNLLAQTNIFVCGMIIVGFLLTSYISYTSNIQFLEKDITSVTKLASAGIFYRVNLIFAEPLNISLAMANDNLLREFLSTEESYGDNSAFINRMSEYLNSYHKKYKYSSVFFVSTQTNNYYHFNGLDRTITIDNPQNRWFYEFINNPLDYSIRIDHDEAGDLDMTVFINTKIRDANGIVLGIVGVGFRVNYLQNMLKKYEEEFSVKTCLINKQGIIEISPSRTALENILWTNDIDADIPLKDIIKQTTTTNTFWASSATKKSYIATRYVPNLGLYLIVENSTDALSEHFNAQAIHNISIIIFIILAVLLTISSVIRKYNNKIASLTAQQQRTHYIQRQQTIKHIYKNICEFDITNNCAGDRRTQHFFENIGILKDTPYDAACRFVANNMMRQEFRDGFINMFSAKSISQAYDSNIKSFTFDFIQININTPQWQRLIAYAYYFGDKQSLRLKTYCYNINDDKRFENEIVAQMQCDPLSGLYTKAVAEELISTQLAHAGRGNQYAFIILGIDNFLSINTSSGYEAGDFVITTFAQSLQEQFPEDAIVARMGGDEFFVFLPIVSRTSLEQQLKSLVAALNTTIATDNKSHTITVSMGVALAPAHGNTFDTLYVNAATALDQTEGNGKNGYTIFCPAQGQPSTD